MPAKTRSQTKKETAGWCASLWGPTCNTKFCPLVKLAAMGFLALVFGGAAIVKFLYYLGVAPEGFTAQANAVYPLLMKTVYLAWLPITAKELVLAVALFEAVLLLALFFEPKIASAMTVAVMVGAEFLITYALPKVASKKSLPAHPMCGATSHTCMAVHGLHAVIAIAGIAIFASKPLCSQVALVWNSFFKKTSNSKKQQ
jgi:hypothetical protein